MDKRKWNGARCTLFFYSEEFFGLARSDYKTVHGKKSVHGNPPANRQLKEMKGTLRIFRMQ